MKRSPMRSLALLLPALLTACGGGGGAPSGSTAVAPTPTPTASSNGCSVRERQDWALAQLREWYLFPETLPTNLDPAQFSTVETYIDALTATARAQRRDRFFTFITSIAGENAFFSSGSSAGFGVRLTTDTTARKSFIAEAFEGAPALAAGIDRGDEIVAIGTTPTTLRPVSEIITAEGSAGVSNALGPSTPGTTRTLRLTSPAGVTRNVTVAKADFNLTPVSSRYGARIIDDGGRRVGYLNLRTFISTADPALRDAFAQFRAAGITQFVIDFRYNGGGLVSTAELIGDLLGANRTTSDVFSLTTFRPEKASNNSTRRFAPNAQSVTPVRVAFIGTGATASASELVINSFIPYLGNNLALIGSNTFGKPVGQIGLDRAQCDDRLRPVAFSTRNASNSDSYFDGLATTVPNSCAAGDDLSRQLGDAQESSIRSALDFLAGRPCTRISATAKTGEAQRALGQGRQLLIPEKPDTAQREVTGLF